MSEQLLLDIQLPDTATFKNFVVGQNDEIVDFLQNTLIKRKNSYAFLWGSPGTGKTHLLKACCQQFLKNKHSVFYLDLADSNRLHTKILDGLEKYDLVCLDNCYQMQKSWEEALFYFFNRSKEAKQCLLIAANQAPNQLNLQLPDLQSRLSWGLVLQLKALEDNDKLSMLQMHAETRGITLNSEVCQYILNHFSRDTHQLIKLLDDIDKRSLIEKRRITIPFLKTL